MDKDPDKPAWLRIGSVVPEEPIPPTIETRRDNPRTVFSLDMIIDAFEWVPVRNSIPSSGISLPGGNVASENPWRICNAMPNGHFQPRFRPGESRRWLKLRTPLLADVIKTNLLAEHWELHNWLVSRSVMFLGDPRTPTYIGEFISKRDQDIALVPDDEARDEWFYIKLADHNDEHGYFQLWCIFREATCLLSEKQTFPEWLIEDLNHLVGQVRFDLRRGRDVANPVRPTKGPPMWAAEILKWAHGKQALPDLPVSLCKLCELPFEERRRGRPSLYCPHCRLPARDRNERARKKAQRRSKSVPAGVKADS